MDSKIEHTDDDDALGGLTDLSSIEIDMLIAIPAAEPVTEGLPNGTAIADELERVRGNRPSAASLYPALAELERDGIVDRTPLGGNDGTGIELTDAGIARVQRIANRASEAVYLARGGRDE